MGNWPATTVEVGSADITLSGKELTLLDLPGIASVSAISPDELLSLNILNQGKPDLILFIVDCASSARCFYLLSELIEQGHKIVVALTMDDVAQRRGLEISAQKLSDELGLPVVKVNPRKAQGLQELSDCLLSELDRESSIRQRNVFINSIEERVEWVKQLSEKVTVRTITKETASDKWDRYLTSPIVGPIFLLGVLWAVFQSTTTFSAPIQDWLDVLINTHIANFIHSFTKFNSILDGLVIGGIIAGVGTLLTFLPVMIFMFLFLSFLEDSGYMARAAVVADRLMRLAGLPGRAILPMLVGFGCNVPAISATRALSDSRHRLITGLAVPFTACSARLAVYVFVASVFFGRNAGTVIFLMYLVSISLVVLFSIAFRKIFVKSSPREPLLIELPPYKLPTSLLVLTDAWIRVKGFLREAGGIVVITVIAVWALMSIPVSGEHSFGEVPVAESAYGSLAKSVSPVFELAGFNDWHTTGALVTGFVAKEVVISSWAQNYSVDGADTGNKKLGELLIRDFEKSSNGHSHAAIWAFLIFLTAYTPCVATVGAQKREFGTRWALIGVGLQIAFAWILAVVVFQLGKLVS